MKILFVLLSVLISINVLAETKTVNILSHCSSSGQLCSPPFSVQVSTGGTLGASYAVGSGHCSSVRVFFLVDGKTVATSGWLGWNGAKGTFASLPKSTGDVNLGPVSSGKHTLGVQAEGQKGGCNHGALHSWGGPLTITTSALNEPKTYACQVIVDKVVKQTTQATDRNDCYKQIGFGSENCSIYGKKGFFPDPNHQYFLDQVFNGSDRVTSEYCPKVAPKPLLGMCKSVRASDNALLAGYGNQTEAQCLALGPMQKDSGPGSVCPLARTANWPLPFRYKIIFEAGGVAKVINEGSCP